MSRLPAVAVLGAAGGIGQPLALLLKTSKKIGRLSLFDLNNCAGVAADLSHIDAGHEVVGYTGQDQLSEALAGADIVVIPAGMPRKPGMARDDLFNTNASVVHKLVEAAAKACPKAWIGVITNPVNSTVPIAAETLKKAGVYDPRKLFGVTTLDLVRAARFLADSTKSEMVEVPVVGGHSGPTIVPVLSSLKHTLPDGKVDELVKRIQYAGEEVVKAKAGGGSATLSMAYAGRRWVESAARAFAGEANVQDYAYVEQKVHGLNFFATKLTLGKDGISEHHPIPKLDAREEKLLKDCVAELTKDINKGLEYAKANLGK